MLHRKYKRKVISPNINFTNTHVKTANTQLILRSRVSTYCHKNLICFFSTNINDVTVVLTTQRFPLVVVY